MTDATNQSNSALTSPPPAGSGSAKGGKSPLDALEELLKTAKAKPGAPAGATELNQTPEEPKKSEEEILAEIEAKKMALKQQEEELVKQQLLAMQEETSHSPQAQARTDQIHLAEEQKHQEEEVDAKYKIRQLSHTKI